MDSFILNKFYSTSSKVALYTLIWQSISTKLTARFNWNLRQKFIQPACEPIRRAAINQHSRVVVDLIFIDWSIACGRVVLTNLPTTEQFDSIKQLPVFSLPPPVKRRRNQPLVVVAVVALLLLLLLLLYQYILIIICVDCVARGKEQHACFIAISHAYIYI